MTQDDIDNGRLIALIGIAPVKPAEFVIFRIMQTKSGTEIDEFWSKEDDKKRHGSKKTSV